MKSSNENAGLTNFTGVTYGEGSAWQFGTLHYHYTGSLQHGHVRRVLPGNVPLHHIGCTLAFSTRAEAGIPAPDAAYVDAVTGDLLLRFNRAGIALLKPPVSSTAQAVEFVSTPDGGYNRLAEGRSVTSVTLRLPKEVDGKEAHKKLQRILLGFSPPARIQAGVMAGPAL